MNDKGNLGCPQLTSNFANVIVDPTQYLFINVDSIKSVVSKINKFNFTLDCMKTFFLYFCPGVTV